MYNFVARIYFVRNAVPSGRGNFRAVLRHCELTFRDCGVNFILALVQIMPRSLNRDTLLILIAFFRSDRFKFAPQLFEPHL